MDAFIFWGEEQIVQKKAIYNILKTVMTKVINYAVLYIKSYVLYTILFKSEV